MVLVYTKYDKLKRDYPNLRVIDDNDSFFEEEENGKTGIDDIDFQVMHKIDGIKFIDNIKDPEHTESKFGVVSLFDMSTGCKTAINLHHAIRDKKKVAVDITECGENAIYECFKIANKSQVPLILQHGYIYNLPDGIFKFLINGELETSDIDILSDYGALR